MAAPVLSVDHLTKNYGDRPAVRSVSFTVGQGEIFALIGPNGAGKSTTLRMLATLLTPTSGSATIAGHNLVHDAPAVRQAISYLPEEAGAYKNLTGRQYLQFMAALYAPDRAEAKAMAERGAALSDLGDRLADKVGDYSKGMTRKLLLGRALMANPTLAILDEPTSGLDVLNAMAIRRSIKASAAAGMAVLLSSHNMLEIEFLSDRVAIIDQGVIHATGTPAELKRKYKAENLEHVFAKAVA